jgi:hypothetical protein
MVNTASLRSYSATISGCWLTRQAGCDDSNIRDTHAIVSMPTTCHADQRGKNLEVDTGVFSGEAQHYYDSAAFDHTGQHSQPSTMQRYNQWLLVNTTGN